MSDTRGRVVIVGAGISGLAASYDLARAGIPATIFEKQPRAGGVIDTRIAEGCTLECGPDSFLSAKPEAVALIKELGLGDEVIGSNDHQRTTYILKHGRLVELPAGVMMIVPSRVMPMVKTSLVGWGTKLRMGLEYFRKPGSFEKNGGDRSVAAFVTDHFGEETLDYLAEPLLSGVYGGDPARLSIASVLPRFLEMEKKYGSLVKGVLAARSHTVRSGSSPAPLFQTLKNGLGKMVDALASHADIQHAQIEAIERQELNGEKAAGFRVRADGDWMEADHIVLACPAWAAGQLVRGLDPKLGDLLSAIDYSSSVTLSLIYKAEDFDGRRAGFGFLVPQKERQRLAACTFVGTKFSYRVPDDRIVLRAFFGGIGGIGDEAILNESDETIIAIAREELQRILGLHAAPISHVISRWPRSMAQYNVGHGARIAEIRQRAAALGGIYLAGNAYEGIGISDCIRTGRAVAKAIIASASRRDRIRISPKEFVARFSNQSGPYELESDFFQLPQFRAELLREIHEHPSADSVALLRQILQKESFDREADVVSEWYENLYHCAFLLWRIGDIQDVLPLWRAKRINMDTDGGMDVEFLIGAGLEKTLDYLRSRPESEAQEALQYLLEVKALGTFDGLAQWAESKNKYFIGRK